MRWWKGLSTDGKTATIGVVILAIIGICAIPGVVERHTGEKPQETKPAPIPPPSGEEPQPEGPSVPKPKIRYVPLPNVAPLKTPDTLVTSIPEGHDQPKTIDIGGEKVPVMTQAEVDPLLTHKVDLSKYQWKYTKPIDVWVTVAKDGTVEQVTATNRDEKVDHKLESSIKQWKFRPFVNDSGEEVAVQTVIQLDKEPVEKPRE